MIARRIVFACALGLACGAHADEAALRARYAADPALRVESRDEARHVTGEIFGLLPQAFEPASAALKDPANWCEILMLHLDTKECRVARGDSGPVVEAGVVSHYDQPPSSAYHVRFAYRLAADRPGYIAAQLGAEEGPMDTSDFHIVFEGLRTPEGRMFAHMSYSYSYGALSSVALKLYLATFGRGKVGFSAAGTAADGSPRPIGGMRGVVERNTMRYYLAVEAWLGAMGLPREARIERALRNWYAAIERYPRQLHELDEARYLEMKRGELGLR